MQWLFQNLMLLALTVAPHATSLYALPSPAEVKKRLEKTKAEAIKSLQLDILGDSISAGALATTRLGAPPSPEFVSAVVASILARDPELFLTATLNPQSAYPDGQGGWSLKQQLIDHYKIQPSMLTLHNESAVGRAMSDVTEKLLKSFAPAKDGSGEHHILVMLGSNDFCQGKTPEGFQAVSRDVFSLIDRLYPKAKVFVAEVPPIHQLKKFSQELIFGQVSCEVVQRLYCDRVHAPDTEAVVRSYNESLRKLVAEANKKSSNGRYKFVGLPADLTIDKDLLATDCFHPGVEGHKKLAAALAAQWIAP